MTELKEPKREASSKLQGSSPHFNLISPVLRMVRDPKWLIEINHFGGFTLNRYVQYLSSVYVLKLLESHYSTADHITKVT